MAREDSFKWLAAQHLLLKMIHYFSTFVKGIAMGAANVIPGVSGGTIAFITGIYEPLIHALKSFDLKALAYLMRMDVKSFFTYIHAKLLFPLLLGVFISFISLAKCFEFLFHHYPVYIWAFFFGLIAASVYFVGKQVNKWRRGSLTALVVGIGIAVAISLLPPAAENESMGYLFLCGVVAICSMIIPGLSGSFVLILLGNYLLILNKISLSLDALSQKDWGQLMHTLKVLFPFMVGCGVGLLAFSHLISWIFRRFHDMAVALLTGFVAGSLLVIWPWKREAFLEDELGETVLKQGGEKIVKGYTWEWPQMFTQETGIAFLLILFGAAVVWLTEKWAKGRGME